MYVPAEFTLAFILKWTIFPMGFIILYFLKRLHDKVENALTKKKGEEIEEKIENALTKKKGEEIEEKIEKLETDLKEIIDLKLETMRIQVHSIDKKLDDMFSYIRGNNQ